MTDEAELIRRAEIGRRVGALIACQEVADVYEQSRVAILEQLRTIDPRDRDGMMILRAMYDGVGRFWGALEGLRDLGQDAEQEAAHGESHDTGRVIS